MKFLLNLALVTSLISIQVPTTVFADEDLSQLYKKVEEERQKDLRNLQVRLQVYRSALTELAEDINNQKNKMGGSMTASFLLDGGLALAAAATSFVLVRQGYVSSPYYLDRMQEALVPIGFGLTAAYFANEVRVKVSDFMEINNAVNEINEKVDSMSATELGLTEEERVYIKAQSEVLISELEKVRIEDDIAVLSPEGAAAVASMGLAFHMFGRILGGIGQMPASGMKTYYLVTGTTVAANVGNDYFYSISREKAEEILDDVSGLLIQVNELEMEVAQSISE